MDSTHTNHGLEPIHMAAVSGDVDQMVKLVCDGVDINSRTPNGVTPLMLSSLMGHKEMTELLIRKKADTQAKDSAGSTALNYAGNCEASNTKRAYFIDKGISKEDRLAQQTRSEIAELLAAPARLKALRKATELGYRDHFMAKRGTKIISFVAFDIVETGEHISSNKTLGLIKPRHAVAPLRYAMSGWRALPYADRKMLDSLRWNNIARDHIAPRIGFNFKRNRRDNGSQAPLPEHCGRMRASHVEVQLATFYALWATSKVVKVADVSVEYLAREMNRLRHASILGKDRDAVIIIDHDPCNDCLRFLHTLQKFTLLSFTIIQRPTLGRVHIGKNSYGCRQDIVADSLSEGVDANRTEEVSSQDEASDQVADDFVDMQNDMYEIGYSQSWDEDEASGNESQPDEVAVDASGGSLTRRQYGLAQLDDAIDSDDDPGSSNTEGNVRDDPQSANLDLEIQSPISNVMTSEDGPTNHSQHAQSRRLPTEEAELIDNEPSDDNNDQFMAQTITTHFAPNNIDIDHDMSLSIEVLDLTDDQHDISESNDIEPEDIEIIDLTDEVRDPEHHDAHESDSVTVAQATTPSSSRPSSPKCSTDQDSLNLGALYAESAAAAAADSLANGDEFSTPHRPLPDLQPDSILGAPPSTASRFAAHRRFIRSFARGWNTHIDTRPMSERLRYRNPRPTPVYVDPYSSPAPAPAPTPTPTPDRNRRKENEDDGAFRDVTPERI